MLRCVNGIFFQVIENRGNPDRFPLYLTPLRRSRSCKQISCEFYIHKKFVCLEIKHLVKVLIADLKGHVVRRDGFLFKVFGQAVVFIGKPSGSIECTLVFQD
jgi:hypothetical protein